MVGEAMTENISIGAAVSKLALADLESPRSQVPSGFPVLPGVEGQMVTDQLVADHRDDDDPRDLHAIELGNETGY